VAPRNRVEQRLVTIWQNVLGIEPISVTDNFFDLGGHSLLAVRLFVKIERRLGRSLPLASIFTAPTVEQLAAMISAGPAPASSGCLVVLQGEGSKPPLFCVSGARGHAFRFRHLARYLGNDQPIYGLQYPGLDGQTEPLTSVEDIAARFIRHIRLVQPRGPYYLCGFSFGGLVAYEMAQQLTGQDERVAMLVMFDSFAPGLYRESTRSEKKMERSENHPDADSPLLNWIERVRMANGQAARCYLPQPPYPGRAILFRSAETSEDSEQDVDPLNGWGEWVRDGLEVHLLPDEHNKMLSKRRVRRALGEKMRACLHEAQMHQVATP
jgi:thioesterase domain-containing protein/acyl carrier protein